MQVMKEIKIENSTNKTLTKINNIVKNVPKDDPLQTKESEK